VVAAARLIADPVALADRVQLAAILVSSVIVGLFIIARLDHEGAV